MNLLLFDPHETTAPLSRADPRARHLLEVLRRGEGGTFDAGLVNGPRGEGTLVGIGPDTLTLVFAWGAEPPPPPPVMLLVGLPRPQTARDILRDATTLGVSVIRFVFTERTESNYAQSPLWTTGEWRRHLLVGAAQAFDTHLPEVTCGGPLAKALADLTPADRGAAPAATHLALDNYEAAAPLGALLPASATAPLVLALGPERGWGPADRALLRAHGFQLAHLGPRPLRLESAVIAALAVACAHRTG